MKTCFSFLEATSYVSLQHGHLEHLDNYQTFVEYKDNFDYLP